MSNDYIFISSRNGYRIGRKVENGRGKWIAERNGIRFPITYDQALGNEPIGRNEALQMQVSRLLFKGR